MTPQKLELGLYQVLELPFAGQDARREGRRLEAANRIVYRPVFTSPITLRVDYQELESPNDLTLLASAPPLGTRRSWEGGLEWLMRWTRVLTTRVMGAGSRVESRDVLMVDPATGRAAGAGRFVQCRAGPELELRVLVPSSAGGLYLVERQQLYRLFGQGAGAASGVGLEASLGVLWTVGDDVYLDAEVAHARLTCFSGPCVPASVITPRVLLSARL